MEQANHIAWRFFGTGGPAYVEHIGNGQQKGDRYSYTNDSTKAKKMTENQCRVFCAYMRDCGTSGFWN